MVYDTDAAEDRAGDEKLTDLIMILQLARNSASTTTRTVVMPQIAT
jgi:hypothetical protein